MKQEEITEINVDDYIREQKELGKKKIIWTGKKEIKIFRRFARINYWDVHFRLPHSFPHKATFRGIKHEIKL